METLLPKLEHLSASSINQFLEYRASWFLKVYKDRKFQENEDTARGKAVEEGINIYLAADDKDDEDKLIKRCIVKAHENFVSNTVGLTIMPDFRATINDLVKKGIETVNRFPGKVQVIQKKIELKIDGVKRPIIGYMDWEYPSRIYDCKVTNKTPNKLKQGHVLQGCVYRAATNKPVTFVYLIPLKEETTFKPIALSDVEFDKGLKLITKAAQAIERIVECELDYDTLQAMMFPNPTSIWKPNEREAVSKEFGV